MTDNQREQGLAERAKHWRSVVELHTEAWHRKNWCDGHCDVAQVFLSLWESEELKRLVESATEAEIVLRRDWYPEHADGLRNALAPFLTLLDTERSVASETSEKGGKA